MSDCEVKVDMLLRHARTMLMMYKATLQKSYIQRAKQDIDLAKSLRRGFLRPLGVLPLEAA